MKIRAIMQELITGILVVAIILLVMEYLVNDEKGLTWLDFGVLLITGGLIGLVIGLIKRLIARKP